MNNMNINLYIETEGMSDELIDNIERSTSITLIDPDLKWTNK